MEENRLREQQRMEEKSQHEPATTELDTGGAPLSESPSKEQESSLSPSGEATADDDQCTITAMDVGDGGPQTEEQQEDLASAFLRRGATEEAQALKGHDGDFDPHLRRALAWYRRGAQSQSTHGSFSAAAAAQCTVVAQMLAGAFGGVGVDDEGAVLHYAVAAASGDINALLAMGHRHAHGCERKARRLEFELPQPKASGFQSSLPVQVGAGAHLPGRRLKHSALSSADRRLCSIERHERSYGIAYLNTFPGSVRRVRSSRMYLGASTKRFSPPCDVHGSHTSLGCDDPDRYGVPPSCEASLFYYQQAARQAEQVYNTQGGQTRVESVILREGLDLTRQDHLGEEDARNAYLRNRAELGDGSAAASLGTRYYWGTHGLQQHHARAMHWYQAALKQKNIAGLVGAAKMLLKVRFGVRVWVW